MVPINAAEMVSPDKYGPYNVAISLTIALSYLLGPLLGGAILNNTTCRWIFYINLPLGAAGFLLIYVSMPAVFPDVSNPAALWVSPSITNFQGKIDHPGFSILLATSVLLIVAIEEAGIAFSWNSAILVVFITLSTAHFGVFLAWECHLYRSRSSREPVFPWQFTKNRVLMRTCLYTLLSGVPYTTLVVALPERFQILNNISGFDADVRILPFTATLGLGAGLAGGLTTGGLVPPFLDFASSAILQILGLGLLYSVDPATTTPLPARLYGYQILSGLGIGASLNMAISIVPSHVTGKDLSIAIGTITQLRILGGTLGVSICTNIPSSTLNRLRGDLPSDTMERIGQDIPIIHTLPAPEQKLIVANLADGYKPGLLMVVGFSAAQLLALTLLWEMPLRKL